MTINLHDGTNHDGLFDLLGKVFKAQKDINTARGTTAETDFLAITTSFRLLADGTDLKGIPDQLLPALGTLQTSANGSMATLQKYAQDILRLLARRDMQLIPDTLTQAVLELVQQMKDGTESVDASTVSVSVAADGGNTGNSVVICTAIGGDGAARELAFAETITAIASRASTTTPVVFYGEASIADRLSQAWPGGSGISKSVTSVNYTSNLLTNGGFETEATTTGVPDGWILSVGTPGTTIKLSTPAVQTIILAGTPTAGEYVLLDTLPDSTVQASSPLAFNASGSEVQSALRALTGNESITVVTTGTTPNFTHTITFSGRGGTIPLLQSISRLDTGTISHATTTAGTPQVYSGGKSLAFASNGSQLTTLNQSLSLSPSTAYGINILAKIDATASGGVITLDLVDGIGGTVLQDAAGNSQSITFNASDLSTSAWKTLDELASAECVFRTPETLPSQVYLRLRISSAVTASKTIYFDHAALTPLVELYPGGPLVAVFTGSTLPASGDQWTITVTNDRAGDVQEWFSRNFDMARLGLKLPSNSAGSETIPDSVIA